MSELPPNPPPPPPSSPYAGGPATPGPPASSGNAVTALVLGILGGVMCGPFTAVPAIVVGRKAMREIDDAQGRLGGRGMAQAGFVLGIVGTVLGALALLLFLGLFALGAVVSNGFSQSCDTVQSDTSTFQSCD
jgi:hypothetical protein